MEDGNVSVTESDYDATWVKHFSKLFSVDVVPKAEAFESVQKDNLAVVVRNLAHHQSPPMGATTKERTLHALPFLPANKAVGPDGFPAEAIKPAISFFTPFFRSTISAIWQDSTVPLAWRGGRIATLFKKGDPLITDNHRGLFISDHMSKALTSIPDDNVSPAYFSNISAEQCRCHIKAQTSPRTFSGRASTWPLRAICRSKSFV